ncbi:MAG: hypothetical protein SGPRY_010672 [Prymnesium sp.]
MASHQSAVSRKRRPPAGLGCVCLIARLAGSFAAAAPLPCDIFSAHSSPCVAAHSVVRALYASYSGPLYSVKRRSDNATKFIGVLAAGGYADSASQDDFCRGTSCIVQIIFDQSPRGNHLNTAPPGGNVPRPDRGVNASHSRLSVGGHPVYAAVFEGGMGYRNDNTSGVATGDAPETMCESRASPFDL